MPHAHITQFPQPLNSASPGVFYVSTSVLLIPSLLSFILGQWNGEGEGCGGRGRGRRRESYTERVLLLQKKDQRERYEGNERKKYKVKKSKRGDGKRREKGRQDDSSRRR